MNFRTPLCGPIAVLGALLMFSNPAAAQGIDSTATDAATLRITSHPDSAIVFLDGRLVGSTPLELEGFAPGPHALRLVAGDPGNWFSDVTRDSIFLEPGSTRTLHYRLEHQIPILTTPSGAEVLIGDSVAGTTPILVSHELARSGALRIRMKGYAGIPVTIPPGANPAVVLQLTPEPGGGPASLPKEGTGPRLTSIMIAAGSVVISGIAAAYFKVSADEKNAAYLDTGDPTLRTQRDQRDRDAAVSLVAMQVSLGLLVGLLLTE